MLAFETLYVCEKCYEDTLLSVSAVDYYLMQENMVKLENLPLESQLNFEHSTNSFE